jgi:hypothetical protein
MIVKGSCSQIKGETAILEFKEIQNRCFPLVANIIIPLNGDSHTAFQGGFRNK